MIDEVEGWYECVICELVGKKHREQTVAEMKTHLKAAHDYVWMASDGLEIRDQASSS